MASHTHESKKWFWILDFGIGYADVFRLCWLVPNSTLVNRNSKTNSLIVTLVHSYFSFLSCSFVLFSPFFLAVFKLVTKIDSNSFASFFNPSTFSGFTRLHSVIISSQKSVSSVSSSTIFSLLIKSRRDFDRHAALQFAPTEVPDNNCQSSLYPGPTGNTNRWSRIKNH